jgi:hypothetical protein
VLPPVPVPPLEYWAPGDPLPPSNALISVLLQKPVIRSRQQLEPGYIWQDLVMVRVCSCVGLCVWRAGRGQLGASLCWRPAWRQLCCCCCCRAC